MAEQEYRVVPPGFTRDQWGQFMEDGYLILEDALSDDEVDHYLELIDGRCAEDPKFDAGKFYGPNNIVQRFPEFSDLIDHPRHLGSVYDVYGELLKLHISQLFVRPRDTSHNAWHPDGPRALPYGVLAPELPMHIEIPYWLTDVPEPGMGNFVCMPVWGRMWRAIEGNV